MEDVKSGTISKTEIIEVLSRSVIAILATAAYNRVTIRPMSIISKELFVYMQTGFDYLKVYQIKANPNVALSIGEYQLEGRAQILGHPFDKGNEWFAENYKIKHPKSFERWSAKQTEIVIRAEINLARRFYYKDGQAFLAEGRFA